MASLGEGSIEATFKRGLENSGMVYFGEPRGSEIFVAAALNANVGNTQHLNIVHGVNLGARSQAALSWLSYLTDRNCRRVDGNMAKTLDRPFLQITSNLDPKLQAEAQRNPFPIKDADYTLHFNSDEVLTYINCQLYRKFNEPAKEHGGVHPFKDFILNIESIAKTGGSPAQPYVKYYASYDRTHVKATAVYMDANGWCLVQAKTSLQRHFERGGARPEVVQQLPDEVLARVCDGEGLNRINSGRQGKPPIVSRNEIVSNFMPTEFDLYEMARSERHFSGKAFGDRLFRLTKLWNVAWEFAKRP